MCKKILLFLIAISLPVCGMADTLQVRKTAAPVSYKESMKRYSRLQPAVPRKMAGWKLYKRLFQRYRQQSFVSNGPAPIPRLIHFVWLGDTLPAHNLRIIESWKKHHPAPKWQILLWTQKELSFFTLENQALIDKAATVEEKTILYSYELVKRFGGLCVDSTIECIKSVEQIHQSCEFYTSLEQGNDSLLCHKLIGSIPEHPIMKRVSELIGTEPPSASYYTKCFNSVVKASISEYKGKVVPFPMTYFYPKKKHRRPESYAIQL